MAPGQRKDPYLAYNFVVEIEGVTIAGFTEVTGLQVEVEMQDYREGGENSFIYKLPGPTRYPSNLILKHGIMDVDTLWNWHRQVTAGKFERKQGSIVLRDNAGEEKWRWNFTEAYPVRWSGPDLRAESTAVAVETLELVHHGLTKGTGGGR